MGIVSDLFGAQNNSKVTAPVNQYQAKGANLDQSSFADLIRKASAQAGSTPTSSALTGEQQLAKQLQDQANGKGPSLAQQQLSNATAQTVNQAASAMASQRGISPALAARLILQNQANATQQAAGQSAQLRSQEQLNAENQLGSVLNNQQAGEVAQTNANTSLLGTSAGAQNAQNATNVQNALGVENINSGTAAQNANLNLKSQEDNAGIAAQNAQTNGGIAGNLIGGAASVGAMLLNKGGQVPGYADGGIVIPGLGMPAYGGAGDALGQGISAGAQSFAQMLKNKKPAGDPNAFVGSPDPSNLPMGSPYAPAFQGAQPLMTHDAAGAPVLNFKGGGSVPGQTQVQGDSPQNDTVQAMLSPGEDVLPRSVTKDPDGSDAADAPERAKAFVAALMKRRKANEPHGYGRVLAVKRQNAQRREELSKMCGGGRV